MSKHVVSGAIAAIAALAAFNASALTTGDMMFTAINADEDGWAMVTFVDLAPNSTVYFTDNEWTGTAFNTGESYHQWVSGPSIIAAGTVVRFTNIDVTGLGASAGTLTRATVASSTNYGISQTEDSIYAYVASSVTAAPTFLAAITTTAFGTASAGVLTNTGLSIGAGAVALGGGADYDEYIGPRAYQLSFAAYKPLVSNIANWTDNAVDANYATSVPNTMAFTLAPIPEPGTYALMLAGLAAVGFVARRRA